MLKKIVDRFEKLANGHPWWRSHQAVRSYRTAVIQTRVEDLNLENQRVKFRGVFSCNAVVRLNARGWSRMQ